MTSRVKRPKSAYPFAFTEHGVTMLSSVLRSDIAIDASILIVRAFVAMRQLALNPPTNKITELENWMKELQRYMDDVFTDQNNINQNTRTQLELLGQSLAELHSLRQMFEVDPNRRRVGYVANNNRDEI